jgi:hypothetical protein
MSSWTIARRDAERAGDIGRHRGVARRRRRPGDSGRGRVAAEAPGGREVERAQLRARQRAGTVRRRGRDLEARQWEDAVDVRLRQREQPLLRLDPRGAIAHDHQLVDRAEMRVGELP